jgi:hypothetical protein
MFSVVHFAHDRLGLESSGFGHPLTASIEFPPNFPMLTNGARRFSVQHLFSLGLGLVSGKLY